MHARRVSAISEAHARNGHPSPAGEWVVRNTMRRLRRDLGAPARGKNPVLVKDLKAMLTHCPATLAGLRDKAILLVGFCGAFRRSDFVNLDIEDLAKADEGLVLMLRKGKTDQKRQGRKIGIPYGNRSPDLPCSGALRMDCRGSDHVRAPFSGCHEVRPAAAHAAP